MGFLRGGRNYRTGSLFPQSVTAARPTRATAGRGRRARFERLEERKLLAATPIEILAAGLSGQEQLELQIDGVTVQTWENVGGDFANRQFQTLQYTHPTDVSIDQIRVAFTEGSGTANDVLVDGVSVAGVFYQTEAATTFSTGTWDSASNSCAPRFAESEVLHCNGYFQFDARSGSTIEVLAAGQQGTEDVALEINGVRVAEFNDIAGEYVNGVFKTLQYTHTGTVTADQVRIVLIDGSANAAGEDQNLRIDALVIDGNRFETEDASVYSTGTWTTGQGCVPGFLQSEFLHCTGGYFDFFQASNGSTIDIFAAGSTNTEQMQLLIDGNIVRTWDNIGGDYDLRQFINYRYNHSTPLAAEQIRVAFVNDGTTNQGADRNLRIDGISIDGNFFQSEAPTVRSTGTWIAANGCEPGFKQSEFLHCNGFFQFAAAAQNPGVIALGSTQFSVPEQNGSVTITFLRTGGSDGPATVDYTTVNASAVAGQDFAFSAGTVNFANRETSRTIDIPITNDNLAEGTETFNVAIDLVTGATAGQPRTATVSIFDDELPSPGNGNGLRGEYFAGQNFGTSLLSRTDVTVNFNWGNGSPATSVPNDNFSVRWTGQIQPLHSQTYTFRTVTDDGIRLWVNNQLIIDQWINQAATPHTGTITLQAGQKYDLRMDYYEAAGQASAQLQWSSPSQTLQTIPTSQLFSDPIVPTAGSFSGENLVSGLSQPTAIEFAPTGQMFVAQKNGIVRVIESGALLPGNFIDLRAEVNNIQDRGLLGLEIDPDFLNRPYIYLLYTYDPPQTQTSGGLAGPDAAGNRVSRLIRVTADASNGYRTVVFGSEIILLGENSTWANISNPDQDGTNNVELPPSCEGVEDCIPVDSRSHSIGALAFAPDGSLFVTNGDGTSFGRVDPRTVRVQDLDSLAGKVLRIDPDTGFGLPDNPFYQSSNPDSNRSKVYNYGLRNPFRLAVHPITGEPYVSDVGWNAWEEINGGRGLNFGWPFYEGGNGQNLRTGGYRDLPEAAAFYANNNATPPLFSRSHANGGVAIVIGDFYTGSLYPSQYQNSVFYTDFGEPTIRALRLNSNGTVQQQLVVTGSVGSIVEMTMGPDGLMYYADLNGSVGRLRFNAAATETQALAAAIAPTAGSAGAAVVAEGNTVEVFGTNGDDEIEISAADGIHAIEINGQSYPTAAGTSQIIVHGRDGQDRIILRGSAGKDELVMGPGLFQWNLPGTRVIGDGLEIITAVGNSEDDVVRLQDTPDNDRVTMRPNFVRQDGGGYVMIAKNFPKMVADSNMGDDRVTITGSDGEDYLLVRNDVTRLSGEGFRAIARGYSDQSIEVTGSNDAANVRFTEPIERLRAFPQLAQVETAETEIEAKGFSRTITKVSGGVATLFGSAGAEDEFIGSSERAELRGEGYQNIAKGFETVFAIAFGGYDRASVRASREQREEVVGGPDETVITGESYQITLQQFERVNTYGGSFEDTATLRGSLTDANEFYAKGSRALIRSEDYFNQVIGFGQVTALGTSGEDFANIHDTARDELLLAFDSRAVLSVADEFRYDLFNFERVTAFNETEGDDDELQLSEIDYVFETVGNEILQYPVDENL